MQLPTATYRLQFHKDFTFDHLEQIIDYLHTLGISTVYASPVFAATPGSQHGYDVADPQVVNPEIGTLEQWRSITHRLQEKGMNWLQDMVPNHMAFDMVNPYLADVLERGNQSPYYRYFDINWEHPNPALHGKLMVPFLGKTLEQAITDGAVKITLNEKGLFVNYFTQEYPLSVSAYALLTEGLLAHANVDALEVLLARLKDAAPVAGLHNWQQERSEGFAALMKDSAIADIQGALAKFNASTAAVQQLTQALYYRLAYWQDSEKEIGFRRFFTVNNLLALRMEDPKVFEDYHRFLHGLYQDKMIQGLRIDHIDGLNDPKTYIDRLRTLFGNDCYIIAEKILESHEALPVDWNLQGTSGYEFLAYTNWLLTDAAGAQTLEKQYRSLLPDTPAYKDLVYKNKKLMLVNYMGGEWENLVHYAYELGLVPKDVYRETFKLALGEFMLCLPVYRLYPEVFPLSQADVNIIRHTVNEAQAHEVASIFELNLIASWWQYDGSDSLRSATILRFLQRLMQYTGPLTAKGVEDTTFYQYNALLGHNEVGDAPDQTDFSIQRFHSLMQARHSFTPHSLSATATHDTKRGEDARLRLNVLSVHTEEWQQLVSQWQQVNAPFVQTIAALRAPSVNDEYFIYQTLLCGYPPEGDNTGDFADRVQQYFQKAVREAKDASNWNNPNEAYEQACLDFIKKLLDQEHTFLQTFAPFVQRIMEEAGQASLAQVLLKITAPGIPDVYQGCELWDLSFVDPDNRRPVDYNIRKEHLQHLQRLAGKDFSETLHYVKAHRAHGVEKMFVTWKALAVRKKYRELFAEGDYVPLTLSRPAPVVAYARRQAGQWAIVVAALLQPAGTSLEGVSVQLPEGAPQKWKNEFTSDVVHIKDDALMLTAVFQAFPVGLLTAE